MASVFHDPTYKMVQSESMQALQKNGYLFSIIGRSLQPRNDIEALVEIHNNDVYQLLIANHNDFSCMTNVEIDGVRIGKFLLQPFSEMVIERPVDRPLAFTFAPFDSIGAPEDSGNPTQNLSKLPLSSKRTCVLCTFQPESGALTAEMDIVAHESQTQKYLIRLEMPVTCTAHALFTELSVEFGEWVISKPCALIHWSTPEYDSPVTDVLTSDMFVALKNIKQKRDPIHKMSLLSCQLLCVTIITDTLLEEKEIEPTEVPTYRLIMDLLKNYAKDDNTVWYFSTYGGRYLGSTNWIPPQTFIYQMLHKHECLKIVSKLNIKAQTVQPEDFMTLIIRLSNSNDIYELECSPDTTFGELRFQLSQLGGPWGEAPTWLFGGAIIDSGRSVSHYGLNDRDAIDIFVKIENQGDMNCVTRRDPIAIEMETEIHTASLLKSVKASKHKKKQKSKKKEADVKQNVQRGGTILNGRVKQEFMEVDAIDVDPRFFTTLLICMLPVEELEPEDRNLSEDAIAQSKTCTII